jgi:hypothetical protein
MAAVRLADSYRVSDRRSTQQIGDREVRERFAERVGRPVNAAAFVTPIAGSASRWCGELAAWAPTVSTTGAAVLAAASGVLEHRNARAAGLPRHLALVVTDHDVHLFRTRMFDHVIGDHVATVPYGMVSAVRVSGRATIVKLTIELADGAEIRLEGERGQGRKTRKVFDYLRDCAAAVPMGTVPPPAVRPEANVAGVLETVAGLVATGAGAVGEQVRAHRSGSR